MLRVTWALMLFSVLLGASGCASLGSACCDDPSCPLGPGKKETSDETGSGSATVTLRVEGLTCPSCASTVGNALRSLEGVSVAQVSFADARAIVRYDPARVTPEEIIKVVTRAGFQAVVVRDS